MPALYLTEEDVRALVTMQDALQTTSDVFTRMGQKTAENQPRRRLRAGATMLHQLAGADQQTGQLGWKIYTTTAAGARFLVGLYNSATGELTALIEADYLGQLRTGAASGVATNLLAVPAACRLGVIGTGLQARTQAWAIQAVRPLELIRVYGRNAERREQFAAQLQTDLNCPVEAVSDVGLLVRESEILVTATTSKEPVFAGADLQPGTHINAVGSNFLKKTELDLETFRRLDLVTCDSREQCQLEAGDFVAPLQSGLLTWEDVRELPELLNQFDFARDDKHITLFKSVGLGVQDVALGALILERAIAAGRGQSLPF